MTPAPREVCIPGHQRWDPAETLLHRLLSDHVETFFAELEFIGRPGLPSLVEGDVQAFLECVQARDSPYRVGGRDLRRVRLPYRDEV